MQSNEDFIWIITPAGESHKADLPATRGIREVTDYVIREGVKIPMESLKSNFEGFFKNVLALLSSIPDHKLPYTLDEIEITAEISGEGKVQLVGGITAGAKGGIKFKLKRVTPIQ